jgi:hypothetical protein
MRHRRRLIGSAVALAALAAAVLGSTAAGGQTPEPGIALAVSIGATVRCTIRGRAIAGPMEGEIMAMAWASDGRQVTEAFERHAFGYRPGAGLLIETYVEWFDAEVHAGPRRPVGEPIELTYVVHNVDMTRLRSVRVRDAPSPPFTTSGRRAPRSMGTAL